MTRNTAIPLHLALLAGLQLICSAGMSQVTVTEAKPPRVVYSDITSGPNSGGENDKGAYLSVFGRDFGASGLGTTTRVYIGDTEVDGYRFLGPSRGRQDIQQITVQVGALGNPKPGVPLPIKVVVDGRASNTDLTFTVNPGNIYFVSLTGSDSRGDGTFGRPYRTVQTATVNNNGVAGCPASSGNQSIMTTGVWGLVRPGDFLVLRGGTWTDVARDNFFLRVQNKSGSAPTGATGTGPITIMGYPGELVFIERANTVNHVSGGGISSADSARQRLGCGSWVTIANLKVESGFNEGPINVQNGSLNPSGSHWRVVNNEMTAISCQNNSVCKAGGVAGGGAGGYWVGNFVHDVYDKPDGVSDFENHGFYLEGNGPFEVAYNRIENIFGGNGIQTYSASMTISNARIHHNIVHGVGKHGINIANGAETGIVIHNNVVSGTDLAGLRFGSTRLNGARVYNNTFFNTDRLNAGRPRAALMNDERLPAGAVEIRNNIIVPGGPRRNYLGGSVGFGALAGDLSNNLWFNGQGVVAGGQSVMADPKFVSTAPAREDFHLDPGSPAVDAGSAAVAAVVADDFDSTHPRPAGAGYDIGAFEIRR